MPTLVAAAPYPNRNREAVREPASAGRVCGGGAPCESVCPIVNPGRICPSFESFVSWFASSSCVDGGEVVPVEVLA